MVVADRKVIVGNPCKIIKDVSEEMIAWKNEGTKIYQNLPMDCHKSLKETEPQTKQTKKSENYSNKYRTWKKTKN